MLLMVPVLMLAACDDDSPATVPTMAQPRIYAQEDDPVICHWSGSVYAELPVSPEGFDIHLVRSPHGDFYPVPPLGCPSSLVEGNDPPTTDG